MLLAVGSWLLAFGFWQLPVTEPVEVLCGLAEISV